MEDAVRRPLGEEDIEFVVSDNVAVSCDKGPFRTTNALELSHLLSTPGSRAVEVRMRGDVAQNKPESDTHYRLRVRVPSDDALSRGGAGG
jgi:hypothetical protein